MGKQNDFNLHNIIVRSAIDFPELTKAPGDKPDWFFRVIYGNKPLSLSVQWLTHWPVEEDEPWLAIGKVAEKYLLRFADLADFHISYSLNEIWCYPEPNTQIGTIRHLFLDQVIPRIISQQGSLVIHASAIISSGRAVAFLGESGQGKSTIVSGLSLRGFPILTDDSLQVELKEEGVYAGSSYPSIRLWSDSISNFPFSNSKLTSVSHYSSKKRIIKENDQISFYSGFAPLDRIYLLCPTEKKDFGKQIINPFLSKRDSFMEMITKAFHLDITDIVLMMKTFEICSRIIDSIPIYSLCVPKDFSKFQDTIDAIVNDIKRTLPVDS